MTRLATAFCLLAAAALAAASAERIEVLKKMFVHLDKDKDGRVTHEEYVGLFNGSFTPQDKNKDNVLTPDEFKHKAAFKHGDADRDGKLTREEYTNIYSSQHKGLDKNKDGAVTTDEYVPAPSPPAATAQPLAAQRQQVLALGKLTEAPAMVDAKGFPADGGIRAIYYDALPWKGKPTKVFGWLGLPAKGDGKVPGVVLVHGGGGTAFKDWVKRWNDRGFAAISIAVEGQSDRRAGEGDEKTETGWLRHEWAGPQRRGIYNDWAEPVQDQWMYHAVAQTVLANSLLRSLPEVAADKVGLMGVSWGGVIASTVVGIDTRFAFAIPTYGCGDLATAENVYGRVLGKNKVYQHVWDPMLYLQHAKMPVLWYSWPEDSHFPMDSLAACYQAASGRRQVTLIPKMGHGHGPAWDRPDGYAFADSVVNTGKPWCRQTGVDLQDGKAEASFASTKPLDRALLISTTDTGFTGKRKWVESPATLERKGDKWTASAELPKDTTAWFLNAYSGKLVVSSEYQEPKKVRAAVKGTTPDAMWTYKNVDGKELKLSVFLPNGYDAGSCFPAFVAFHGGSWNAGDANWHYPDCAYWSKRGMVAVSVDYRLKERDKVQVPLDCIKDAKSAIRFLRQNAAKLKIDPERIVAAGGSAGGQLAAATAMLTSADTNDDQYDLATSCRPNAVVLWNPWFKCQKDLSPPNFVTEGLPPFITFLGDQDPGLPAKSLKAFHESLTEAGNASEYYVGKGGKHGFCNGRNPGNPFFYWSLELTDQFLVKHGMLTGPSLVQIPQGVKTLGQADFESYREPESLPLLKDGVAPQTFEAMWEGYDPRAEPLETEVLKEWEEDGVVLRVLRYRIGVFKGRQAMMAAVYGFPKGGAKLPGLVQIHGGGQYADHRAPLYNAKRGYATISISWGGRISAPDYRVDPNVTKLFWDGKTDDPAYKIATDWGALDAYHAPNRNAKNSNWGDLKPAPWTLDPVESPRNSNWFLCTLGARRALTFLEQQAEVDGAKLGVYGHSMGGRLTVMTAAIDERVKAAAPSCGGISKRDPKDSLDSKTISDDVSLARVSCPIMFLSPANDFHGRINDLQRAVSEISSKEWRLTCGTHHNHQDTAEYMVATPLWFDQYLKNTFTFPATPPCELKLETPGAVPSFSLTPDTSQQILAVDVYYTQQGKDELGRDDMQNTVARFWHHAATKQTGKTWTASLSLLSTDRPLWVYANVTYPLAEPVTGSGYYYGPYTAETFVLSSTMQIASPEQLQQAGVEATRKPSLVIEDFAEAWQKEWFTYDLTDNWARRTHKIYDDTWQAPPFAKLTLSVRAEKPSKMVVGIDGFAAEVSLKGNSEWQDVTLFPTDFQDATGRSFLDWAGIKELRLGPQETLRSGNGAERKTRQFGAPWQGPAPEFRDLRWVPGTKDELNARRTVKLAAAGPDNTRAYLTPEAADAFSSLLPLRPDTDMHGKPLVVDGKTHEHGVTLHAPSKAIFFLGGKYAKFHAIAAAGPNATVSFQVILDGRQVFDSDRLTRSGFRVIDLPVKQGQEIQLIVTDGGNGKGGDWAHWIDAWVSQ